MAYKLKPNYHFSDMDQTGIDKVPVGRFIIVEDVGSEHEIKWYKKVSDQLLDELGDPDGQLDGTSTLTDALNGQAIEAPLDYKRDITDSYSIAETDSILTLKRDITDSYSISDVDSNFRRIEDSYTKTEVDSLVDAVNRNTDGIVETSNTISANYDISQGSNALIIGPITIADNVILGIPDGSVLQLI